MSKIDLRKHMRPTCYKEEYVIALPDAPQEELAASMSDQRAQAYLKASARLMSLRMEALLFGASEAWVQAQLTDADRAALAKSVEPVEQRLLASPEVKR